ncbi:MAG: TonB-dependent receptor [Saprospiraceae bacterium]|nr:TonB-dependent receptor [Saprospiraceae bacterium]
MLNKNILLLTISCFPLLAWTQSVQTCRGIVFEQETLHPLTGVNIVIEATDLGTSTDQDGHFEIPNIPVGRHNIIISYLGFEPVYIRNLLITTGKEAVLDIGMTEALISMEEVVIKANADKSAPLNDMAIASVRSFTVEETSRYASSIFDPARMAMNFAGVSTTGGTSDLFNEIIVRGNSPRGVLWRLEGIEIPNPNHFGGLGNSGGGISMLSSGLIATSDFYTGAFPSEFGNAISGAFDLNLRKGNNKKREHSFMFGILGTEVASEGPISKGKEGSYLFNFRYSTLGILKQLGLSPVGDVLPEYGDLSFNIHFPGSALGRFNLFGLMGKNRAYIDVQPDSTRWRESDDDSGFNERQTTGTIGLSHKILIDNHRYFHTVLAVSIDNNLNDEFHLDKSDSYRYIKEFENRFDNYIYRLSTSYNQKINNKNSIKAGLIGSYHDYHFYARDYKNNGTEYVTYLQDTGSSAQLQTFVQWKHRFSSNITGIAGFHYNYFGLTRQQSLEPRFSFKWQFAANRSIHLATGLYSKPEHPVFYFTESSQVNQPRVNPNRYLDYIKSWHLVGGYAQKIGPDLRIAAEVYYQYLFDVPVEALTQSRRSILNAIDVWDVIRGYEAVNTGAGKNYGIDLTIEKNFNRSYYFLCTSSLFNSRYKTYSGEWFNTRFNSKYQVNILGGKEFNPGAKKDRYFTLNGKIVLNGGNRITPIDLAASREQGRTIRDNSKYLEASVGRYYRFDLGISYKIIRSRLTHTLMLDIQNLTNHLNRLEDDFDRRTGEIEYETYTGLFPVINYRIEF